MAIAEIKEQWQVKATHEISYNVIETEDIFSLENTLLANRIVSANKRCLIIIDTNVKKIYGNNITKYFNYHGISTTEVCLFVTEEQKEIKKIFEIVHAADNFSLLRRSEPVIAIGGGVLLDIVGLFANIYRRGVPYIRIPTTLMGLIDAGIGVKTGVNFSSHKNRLGTYFAPSVVYLDRQFIKTLNKRHIVNGIAEIIKIALVKNRELFELLEAKADTIVNDCMQGKSYSRIFELSVCGMLEELAPNLWEKQLERAVDFGHTFSPKIEMQVLPKLLHGEAVSVDMAVSMVLSAKRNLTSCDDTNRALNLLRKIGLPIFHDVCTANFLYECIKDATLHRDGLQRIPLTVGIGNVSFFNDISMQELTLVLKEIKNLNLCA